jgi:hypothetical protein
MRTTRFIRQVAARWRGRVLDTPQDTSSERGDTLLEVLIAITILGITGIALLAGFATAITSSGEHRNLASLDSSTRIAANEAIATVQQQAGNASNNPFVCPSPFTPSFPSTLTDSFTVSATVAYWDGTQFSSGCVPYAPQQYTLTVSSTVGGQAYSTVVTTVIYDPSAPPSPNGVGAPTQLAWLQTPTSGVAGISITPQPELAVEDANNNIVTSDFSSVSLQQVSGPGSLSDTCFGAETYGIVQFSGCSFDTAGKYVLVATDPGLPNSSQAQITVYPAPAAKLVFTSAAVSGTASNGANLGQITVKEEDALGNPTTAAETVTLSSSSSGIYVFNTTKNATTPTGPATVTIPAGQSTASFYYGDEVAGSPTISASAPGLAPGTQVETINAGSPTHLAFTSSAFTAPNNGAITTPFTVALQDQFNNVATATASTKVNLSSTSAAGKFAVASGGNAVTSVTITTGQSSMTAYYGDTTVGTPTITAAATGLTTATQAEQVVAAPTKLVFTTGPVSGISGTTASLGPITVQEQTSTGIPTTVGETVNLTSNAGGTYIFNTASGASTPTGSTSVTIPSGQNSVTFYYGGTKAGSPVITAAATGLTSATQTETIAVGPATSFGLSAPSSPAAGNAFTETITAQDAGGNTVTGFTGTNCVTFSGPTSAPGGQAPAYPASGSCLSGSAVTFNNGVGTAPITLYNAQAATLTATDGLITGSTASFTVSPGAASAFALSAPSPIAGTSFPEAISATDTYGNNATSYTGTKCLIFSGPSNSPSHATPIYPAKGSCATGSSAVAFAAGVGSATITLVDAQTTALQAVAGAVTGTSSPFTVSSGPVANIAVANPGSQTAGTAFNATITATDTYGNAFNGTLVPNFSGPTNSPNATAPSYPSSVAFTNGSATPSITLYNAQSTTLKMTSGSVSGTSSLFTVSAAPAATLAATTGANQSASVNSAFATKLVATATDAYGNPVSGVAVTFAAPSSGASATFAACSSNLQTYSCTQTTTATGQATSSTFTANGTNGAYTITASGAGLTATYSENNKGNQTISFTSTAPSSASVGGATYTPAATATSGLPVTITVDSTSSAVCTMNAGVVSFTGGGTCRLDANQAGNGIWNAGAQVQQTFTVAKGNQTISFTSTAPSGATVGGATYSPSASSTSGLTVAITVDSSSSSVCAISGGVVSFNGPGTCTLDANQAGNGNYNAAAQVQQAFTVKRNQTVSFTSTAPTAASVGGGTYTPTASSTSGLTVAITVDSSSSSVCAISGGVVSFNGVGTCTLDANQAGNGTYNAAAQVQQNVTVKTSQAISFTSTAPSGATVGGATYSPTASSTSGLTVAITVDSSSSSVCAISGGVVSFTGSGTCTLDANQGGNGNYNAAAQVQQAFTVAKGSQTISFTSTKPSGATVGGATYSPTATSTSGLTVAITVDSSSSSVCAISGGVVSFNGVGTCTLDANQAGNGTYNAAAQLQQAFTVAKGNQTISFTSTAPSGATVGGATYSPSASSTSGLTVAITVDSSSSSVCAISGGVVSFNGPGTCTLDANQAGNGNYNAAAQVQQAFTVKRNQTVSFTSTAPTAASVGGGTYTAAATATSGLTVAITADSSSSGVCSISGSVVSFQGSGTCTLDANQAGNGTYNAATQVQQSFNVVGLTITDDQFGANGPKVFFDGVGATGTARVTITVCSVNSFPCNGPRTVSTLQTGTSPGNPWTTTGNTSSLSYGTTYFAEATQGTQTSDVFTFTPAQPTPTAVALANGGTAKKIDSGDTATVTFSDQLDASTICGTWGNSGIQTVTNATVTFTSANPDSFTATSSTCGNGAANNFGTVTTGSTGYVTGTVTFTGSTIAWNPNNDTLTFTLGTLSTGSGNVVSNVTAAKPGYAPDSNVADLAGFPVTTSTFTSGTTSGF